MFWKLYSSNFEKLDEKFEELNETLQKQSISIKNKVILELGPGNSFINAYNFLMQGAEKVVLVDKFPRVDKTPKQIEFQQNEILFIKMKYKKKSLPFIKEGKIDSPKIQVIGKDLTEIKELPGVDFIYSISVLEHVKKIKKNIQKMYEILNPGGYMFHKIDLRDHYNFNRPFIFYKYSDKTWNKYLTKEELSYTNRVRYDEFEEWFKEAGFEIVDEELDRFSINKVKIHTRLKKFNPIFSPSLIHKL